MSEVMCPVCKVWHPVNLHIATESKLVFSCGVCQSKIQINTNTVVLYEHKATITDAMIATQMRAFNV